MRRRQQTLDYLEKQRARTGFSPPPSPHLPPTGHVPVPAAPTPPLPDELVIDERGHMRAATVHDYDWEAMGMRPPTQAEFASGRPWCAGPVGETAWQRSMDWLDEPWGFWVLMAPALAFLLWAVRHSRGDES